jgi:cytochrome c553
VANLFDQVHAALMRHDMEWQKREHPRYSSIPAAMSTADDQMAALVKWLTDQAVQQAGQYVPPGGRRSV